MVRVDLQWGHAGLPYRRRPDGEGAEGLQGIIYHWRIKHLEGVDGKLESIETKLDALKTDVTILKVKAGLYGVLGGFVVTIIVNAMIALIHAGKI